MEKKRFARYTLEEDVAILQFILDQAFNPENGKYEKSRIRPVRSKIIQALIDKQLTQRSVLALQQRLPVLSEDGAHWDEFSDSQKVVIHYLMDMPIGKGFQTRLENVAEIELDSEYRLISYKEKADGGLELERWDSFAPARNTDREDSELCLKIYEILLSDSNPIENEFLSYSILHELKMNKRPRTRFLIEQRLRTVVDMTLDVEGHILEYRKKIKQENVERKPSLVKPVERQNRVKACMGNVKTSNALCEYLFQKCKDGDTGKVRKGGVDWKNLEVFNEFKTTFECIDSAEELMEHFVLDLAPNFHWAPFDPDVKLLMIYGFNIPVENGRFHGMATFDEYGYVLEMTNGQQLCLSPVYESSLVNHAQEEEEDGDEVESPPVLKKMKLNDGSDDQNDNVFEMDNDSPPKLDESLFNSDLVKVEMIPEDPFTEEDEVDTVKFLTGVKKLAATLDLDGFEIIDDVIDQEVNKKTSLKTVTAMVSQSDVEPDDMTESMDMEEVTEKEKEEDKQKFQRLLENPNVPWFGKQRADLDEDIEIWIFLFGSIHDPITKELVYGQAHPHSPSFWQPFVNLSSPKYTSSTLKRRFEDMKHTLHLQPFTTSNKLKLYFSLKIPLNKFFLESLPDTATVELDDKCRLTKYHHHDLHFEITDFQWHKKLEDDTIWNVFDRMDRETEVYPKTRQCWKSIKQIAETNTEPTLLTSSEQPLPNCEFESVDRSTLHQPFSETLEFSDDITEERKENRIFGGTTIKDKEEDITCSKVEHLVRITEKPPNCREPNVFSSSEETQMWMFLLHKSRDLKSGEIRKFMELHREKYVSWKDVWEEFRIETKSSRKTEELERRFSLVMCPSLYLTDFPMQTKIELYYGLDIPVETEFLEELEARADVEINENGCIQKYVEKRGNGLKIGVEKTRKVGKKKDKALKKSKKSKKCEKHYKVGNNEENDSEVEDLYTVTPRVFVEAAPPDVFISEFNFLSALKKFVYHIDCPELSDINQQLEVQLSYAKQTDGVKTSRIRMFIESNIITASN